MIYQIPNWSQSYENNKSRQIEQCKFFCMSNSTGDIAFSRIMARPDGASIYGVFVLLLTIASSHGNPRQGWLTRDGRPGSMPLSVSDFACMWRRSEAEISTALEVLASPSVGWLLVHPEPVTASDRVVTASDRVVTASDRAVTASDRAVTASDRAVTASDRAVTESDQEGMNEEKEQKEENERMNPLTPRGGGEVLLSAEVEKPSETPGKVWQPSAEQRRINSWYRRRDESSWSFMEIRAFRDLPETTAEEWDLLEQYCLKATYRRKDILTLLNHWTGEIDRARDWCPAGEDAETGPSASETSSGYQFTVPTEEEYEFEADFRALRKKRERTELILAGLLEPETEEEEALCR